MLAPDRKPEGSTSEASTSERWALPPCPKDELHRRLSDIIQLGAEPGIVVRRRKEDLEGAGKSIEPVLSLQSQASRALSERLFSDGAPPFVYPHSTSALPCDVVIAVRNSFDQLLSAFDERCAVSIAEYKNRLELLGVAVDRPGMRVELLHMLESRDLLRPVPAFYWQVNRGMEECSTRVSVDFTRLLPELLGPQTGKTLVEFGQGNGRWMAERRALLGDGYLDVGICNALHYQIDELLEQCIDFDALAKDGAVLTPAQRSALCRFLYKVFVLDEDSSSQEDGPIYSGVLGAIRYDLSQFLSLLRRRIGRLETVQAVPADPGVPDVHDPKRILYPTTVSLPDEPSMQRARQLLARSPKAYLRIGPNKKSVYDLLPVEPCGAIAADFRTIGALRPKQIDVALGIRSTQYLEGEEYLRFMTTIPNLLTEEGIYIDDNVRLNFGRRYRIEELAQVQEESGCPVGVIRGNGQSARETHVPVALVMTHSPKQLDLVRASLLPGADIATPQDLLNDPAYMEHIRSWWK